MATKFWSRNASGHWADSFRRGFGLSNRHAPSRAAAALEQGAATLHKLAARLDGETVALIVVAIKHTAKRAHDWADTLASAAREQRKARALYVLQNLANAEACGEGAPLARSGSHMVPRCEEEQNQLFRDWSDRHYLHRIGAMQQSMGSFYWKCSCGDRLHLTRQAAAAERMGRRG